LPTKKEQKQKKMIKILHMAGNSIKELKAILNQKPHPHMACPHLTSQGDRSILFFKISLIDFEHFDSGVFSVDHHELMTRKHD
jgi:hypothetical protein